LGAAATVNPATTRPAALSPNCFGLIDTCPPQTRDVNTWTPFENPLAALSPRMVCCYR
jgi:hypothetical protein